MKKLVISAIITSLFSGLAFADYASDMKNGKAAYMSGNYEMSLKYYNAAFSETPTVQLGDFIVRLETKVKNAGITALPEPGADTKPAAGKGINAGTILLCITDLALIGTAIYGYMDYNNAADNYDVLYTTIDNTNMSNYNRLTGEMNKVKGKETFMGIFAGLAGAAVLYTLADSLFIHAAFQKETAFYFNPSTGETRLVLNREF